MFHALTICATTAAGKGIHVAGIPFEFILFGATLVSVAVYHNHTLKVALIGLAVITLYKVIFEGFSPVGHFLGSDTHAGEWGILLNLFGLLTGFAVLADHFERSHVPGHLPQILPGGWLGVLAFLFLIFVLSTFLDNIAAAMIGGSLAQALFKGKVHIGFLAAIVAASNAGGAGSVLGDTTTTMMWIDGVSAFDVLHGFVASAAAFLVFGIPAAIRQHRMTPVQATVGDPVSIDWVRISVVAFILGGAIATNILLEFPALGVWGAILVSLSVRRPDWKVLPSAISGSIFLLSLVFSASMMPVEELPPASWPTSLLLGFVSSVFDNIPLTKLALDQMGYDWGLLAYAVGFGGSMIWFGSSAGVALSNMYPQIKSVKAWVRNGWFIAVAYLVGFFVLLLVLGWNPHAPHK